MGQVHYSESPIGPANKKPAVVPDDNTTYLPPLKGLYVGTGGTVAVLAPGDTVPAVYVNLPNAAYIMGFISKVMLTGTVGAANLVGDQ